MQEDAGEGGGGVQNFPGAWPKFCFSFVAYYGGCPWESVQGLACERRGAQRSTADARAPSLERAASSRNSDMFGSSSDKLLKPHPLRTCAQMPTDLSNANK